VSESKRDALELYPEREPDKRVETFMVQEQSIQQGWPVKITLCHYRGLGGRPGWTEVFAEWDHEPKALIGGVSLDLLKRIFSLAEMRRSK
jgi:hypothetical protein